MSNFTRCIYPELPLRRNEFDTRQFRAGEEVCLRNQPRNIPERGIYVRSHPQPGTGHVYIHIIDSPGFPGRWVKWGNVGKVKVNKVSKTAVRKLAENRNLPENVETYIKGFGGGKKKGRNFTRKRRSIPRGA